MMRGATIAVAGALLLLGAWIGGAAFDRSTGRSAPAPQAPSPQQSSPNRTGRPLDQNQPSGRRTWPASFFSRLSRAVEGDPVQFDLLKGEVAFGRISQLRRSGDQIVYVAGNLSQPEPGRFFFQKQTRRGVAGDYVGVVEFPASQRAYRLEPIGPGGASELVARPLSSVLCLELPRPGPPPQGTVENIPPLDPDQFPTLPIPDYQNGIVVLESQPGALPVIYLDFQGGYTAAWGGITYQRATYDNDQIREIWKRVAEDYMPFNINVVTDLKVFQQAPEGSRQRVIISPTDTAFPEAGGVAYVGSFDWTGDTPCWVFVTNGPVYCAQACSHESGHCLGLLHDGQQVNGAHVEYYYGHGQGETRWAPIMGVAYYDNVTQWSRGEYIDANNLQDQLAIITSQNDVRFRADDTGDSLATSRYLEVYADQSAGAEGLIETSGDTDAFQFTTGGGTVSLRAEPVSLGPNLALQVTLWDAADSLIASNNPQDTLSASLTTNLPSGTYTFRVTGAGRNDPLTNGFSAYASLGYYSITGTVAQPRLPSRFSIPEHSPNGTLVGTVSPANSSGDPLNFRIVAGNEDDTFALDDEGTLTVANNALLDYATLGRRTQLPVQFELLVDLIDPANPALGETNRRVVVSITPVKQPPVIAGFLVSNTVTAGSGGAFPHFVTSVPEHSPPGTVVGTLLGSDPDLLALLSYAIVAGNDDGMFALGDNSGVITVAGDPVAARQAKYQLTITVSDEFFPSSLVTTSLVSIVVELPYARGAISYALYTNIAGTLVTDLTSAPSFPRDPAGEVQLGSAETGSAQDEPRGGTMRGYLLPPATGLYTFWIASEDNSELLLSSSTNTEDLVKIAGIEGQGSWAGAGQWTKYPSQQSWPILLDAGRAYYLEARMKAGGLNDYLAVAWESATNGMARQIIPGQYLSAYHLKYQPHPVGFTAWLHRDAFAGSQLGRVQVTDVNGPGAEVLSIVAGNDQNWFSLDPATGLLRLADEAALQDTNQQTYVLTVKATDDDHPPLSGTATVVIHLAATNAIQAGALVEEIWTNSPGNSVADLTGLPAFPKRPDALRFLPSWESRGEIAPAPLVQTASGGGLGILPVGHPGPPAPGHYGFRVRACLRPSDSGWYTFFISSSDDCVLLFGPANDPGCATNIASLSGAASDYLQWAQYATQQSPPLWLEAGGQYYIESLYQAASADPGIVATNGAGAPLGSHLEVGWAGPGLPGTNVIGGAFLQPVDIEYAPERTNTTIKFPRAVALGAPVAQLTANDSPLDSLCYKIISGNETKTFLLDGHSGVLSIADNLPVADGTLTNFELVVAVQDSGYGGLYPLKSSWATVHVQVVDNSKGIVTWSGTGPSGQWSDPKNWSGVLPNNQSTLIFGAPRQMTNQNDLLAAADSVSINGGGFFFWGNPLILSRGIDSGGNNTWAIQITLGQPQTFTSFGGTLDVAADVENDGNLLTVDAGSPVHLDAVLSGSGGLTKFGAGTLWIAASNTYTGPTLIQGGTVLLTNSGAIASSAGIKIETGGRLDVSGTTTPYLIPPGQLLAGSGTVIGPIEVAGALEPEFLPTAPPMVFLNRLTLAGNTLLTLGQTLNIQGELQCGGVLTVSTNPRTLLAINRPLKLFTANQYSGAFTQVNLPGGFNWDISGLATNGTIRALSIVPATLPILPLVRSNGVVFVRFQSNADSRYVLESTLSLRTPVHWSQSVFLNGTGKIVSVPFATPENAPQRFFRVKVN